jgi:hypothetical protein
MLEKWFDQGIERSGGVGGLGSVIAELTKLAEAFNGCRQSLLH